MANNRGNYDPPDNLTAAEHTRIIQEVLNILEREKPSGGRKPQKASSNVTQLQVEPPGCRQKQTPSIQVYIIRLVIIILYRVRYIYNNIILSFSYQGVHCSFLGHLNDLEPKAPMEGSNDGEREDGELSNSQGESIIPSQPKATP